MITKSKVISIMWRLNNDAFTLANKEQFIDKAYPRRISSSLSAVNNLLANGDELKALMPRILGIDPKSTSSNWDKVVSNYWHSLTVEVYSNGLDLEIGFHYDIDNIPSSSVSKKIANIKTDEELAQFVEGFTKDGKPNVPDNEKYKYAVPIKEEDWLLYRYCVGIDGKGYKLVANSLETVNASKDIEFYIYDESIAKKARIEAHELNRKALAKYIEVLNDRDTVSRLLSVFKVNQKGMEDIDKDMALDTIAKSQPKLFLSMCADSNLLLKAQIEDFINAGVIRRIPGSSLIVDAKDPSVIVGNTLNEAVTYFSDVKNKAQISEYELMYKQKTKK